MAARISFFTGVALFTGNALRSLGTRRADGNNEIKADAGVGWVSGHSRGISGRDRADLHCGSSAGRPLRPGRPLLSRISFYTGGAHGALFALRALTAGVSLKTLGACYALHPLFSLRPLFSLQTTVSFFSFIAFRASWPCGPSIALRPYGPSIALGPHGTGVSLNPLGADKTLITLGAHITSDPLRTLRPLNASHSARPGWTGAPRISFWPLRAL